MSGSSFGKLFRITTWGESHGAGIGVVIDGCPAGLALDANIIQTFLDRRRPGQNKYTTKRSEPDTVEILSGVFEGKTTGTPISLLVRNQDQRSRDYGNIAHTFRPGHADYGFFEKYGIRDYRGGGRSSGRETIGRVAAGAVASAFLKELGISVRAYSKSIGPYTVSEEEYCFSEIFENSFYLPNNAIAEKAAEYVSTIMSQCDSCGGIIECTADGLPAGLGEPVFDKLDALLSQAIMSIGAVKGVEIGDGFLAAASVGSRNNDPFYMDGLILRAAVKPTSSISRPQDTVNEAGENTEILVKGRHDPLIVPRAVVVVEAMTAITLADLLLQNMCSRIEHVRRIYTEE